MRRPVWPDILRLAIVAGLCVAVVWWARGWWWHP
jgi:hypothetical protein